MIMRRVHRLLMMRLLLLGRRGVVLLRKSRRDSVTLLWLLLLLKWRPRLLTLRTRTCSRIGDVKLKEWALETLGRAGGNCDE